jgi:hypothetical protein
MCGDSRRLPWGYPKNTVTTVTNRHPLGDYPPKERKIDYALCNPALRFWKKSLSEWQTAYHKCMSARWNQLERGQSSMETKRRHIPTWLYKLGGRLDKQYAEIVSALSDINAFNAGKKRDKALEMIAAWLPDVEKFSKEIGKQRAYIDSLKERIGQESDYAGRMRDEKYEQELKVQKANQRIFELQKTNQQMERLLKKIPPEVLEELQKTGRTRQKER